MAIEELYKIYIQHPTICTDSRKITKGCLFFALKGDNFDGNTFVKQALEQGAKYAISDDPIFSSNNHCIVVDDVLETLQLLANYHRKQYNIPVLALTGSNGKTTTKELCREVISKKFRTFATTGNLNNHIGVPLTILSTTKDVEFLIVEMGANHQEEIDDLCRVAEPSHVMITNIGKAHLEGFGGVEGIKKGKSEMYRYASAHHAQIFINTEDDVLMSLLPKESATIPYAAQKVVSIIKEEPFLTFKYKDQLIQSQLYGAYNLPNIAFAIVLGEFFNIATSDIIEALASYIPENNRSQMAKIGTNTIIKDAYNANPSSMRLSIQSFAKLNTTNKLLILGDMLELGDQAAVEHSEIIQLTRQLGLDKVLFIGPHFYSVKSNDHGLYFLNVETAKKTF